MGYMQYDGNGASYFVPTEGDPGYVAPAKPSAAPVSQGLSSYDSFNLNSDNWVIGNDGKYYKQTGPTYNSDGVPVSMMGLDPTPYTADQLKSMGATQRTISPDYNTKSAWDNPLTGAGVFLGGLGALGAIPGITGAIGDWAGLGSSAASSAGSNAMGSIGDWFSSLFNGGSSGVPTYLDPNTGAYTGDLANAGYVDTLGGMTDSTGTALPQWASSAGLNSSQATQLMNSAKSILGGNTSLLGTALGGLLGSINGSKQAGTITQTQEPWGPQQPYLLDAWNKAKQASGGSPLQTQANSNYSSVLSGPTKNPYLGMDNPYLTQAIDYANQDTTRAMMPAMNQANRASGSFGNSGVADTFGRQLADQYGRNANSMRMTDYTNQQNLAQQQVNNTLGFTQNANNYAAQPAQNYAQTVQGNYGGSSSSPYFNNPMAGILGGAAIGNKIGSIWG